MARDDQTEMIFGGVARWEWEGLGEAKLQRAGTEDSLCLECSRHSIVALFFSFFCFNEISDKPIRLQLQPVCNV